MRSRGRATPSTAKLRSFDPHWHGKQQVAATQDLKDRKHDKHTQLGGRDSPRPELVASGPPRPQGLPRVPSGTSQRSSTGAPTGTSGRRHAQTLLAQALLFGRSFWSQAAAVGGHCIFEARKRGIQPQNTSHGSEGMTLPRSVATRTKTMGTSPVSDLISPASNSAGLTWLCYSVADNFARCRKCFASSRAFSSTGNSRCLAAATRSWAALKVVPNSPPHLSVQRGTRNSFSGHPGRGVVATGAQDEQSGPWTAGGHGHETASQAEASRGEAQAPQEGGSCGLATSSAKEGLSGCGRSRSRSIKGILVEWSWASTKETRCAASSKDRHGSAYWSSRSPVLPGRRRQQQGLPPPAHHAPGW